MGDSIPVTAGAGLTTPGEPLMLRDTPLCEKCRMPYPSETSDMTSPKNPIVGDDEVFVKSLRAIAEQFLAILPSEAPIAPCDREA